MSPHIVPQEKMNKENFAKLVSMFEVQRPKKALNSTLRKSKSISSLSTAISSDEEEIKLSEKKVSPVCCSRAKDMIKRRTKSTRSTNIFQEEYFDDITKNIEQTNKMVEDFGETLRLKRQQKTDQTKESDVKTDKKNKGAIKDTDGTILSQSLDRRFTKNAYRNHTAIHNMLYRELTSRNRNMEKRRVQSFKDDKFDNEVENYRALVQEIDSELEKMKTDGFIDTEENALNASQEYESFEEVMKSFDTEDKSQKSTWAQRVNIRRQSSQDNEDHTPHSELGLENITRSSDTLLDDSNTLCDNKLPVSNIFNSESDDEFGACLAEDIEKNGSYFVEAYNDEGKELIIVEIAVERRAIDLSSLETITESIENSDIVFHQNEDRSLSMIDNPKEFVSSDSFSNGFITNSESSRSTLFSNASRYSMVFDTDDDESISLESEQKEEDDHIYNNYRRETFCDNQGIVRIEREYENVINCPELENEYEELENFSPVSRNNSFTQKGTLSYIIDEIKTTERKYVDDLSRVVTKYMPYIVEHTPPNLIGTQCYIFGNIDKLYNRQKEFLAALENCDDETVDEIVKLFIDFEKLFRLYPKYFKNKPRADMVLKDFSKIVKHCQNKFDERLDLSSYLLTPLQRLGKYKLFLENIEKQLKKLDQPIENVQMALNIVKREMSKGNDFVAIESIENSPISKEDYGSFIMREIFNILKPRRFEAMIFLFENIVVFTISDPRNMDIYNYYTSIRMTDLRIATFEDTTIHLTDFTKSKRMSRADRFTYILEAKTQKIRETWRTTIEDILWKQLQKAKGGVIPKETNYE